MSSKTTAIFAPFSDEFILTMNNIKIEQNHIQQFKSFGSVFIVAFQGCIIVQIDRSMEKTKSLQLSLNISLECCGTQRSRNIFIKFYKFYTAIDSVRNRWMKSEWNRHKGDKNGLIIKWAEVNWKIVQSRYRWTIFLRESSSASIIHNWMKTEKNGISVVNLFAVTCKQLISLKL